RGRTRRCTCRAPTPRRLGCHPPWRRPPALPGPCLPWTRVEARPLPRLLVDGVLPVPAAVLLHLDPVAVVLLVLGGDVVAPLADLAGQRDLDSLIAPGHWNPLLLHFYYLITLTT